MKAITFLIITLFTINLSTFAKNNKGEYTLITSQATPETKKLYQQLADMQGKGILFGHHFSNVSGINFTDWKQTKNKSDIKESVSDYPAMFGFDFGSGFSKLLPSVIDAAKRGGVITFSDHALNPMTNKSYKHNKEFAGKEINSVLPGGEHHNLLLARLDSIAEFANNATINGRKIPIIYRPWHEHTGRWFWWGTDSGTPEEFCALWRFTVEYLRDTKGVDNFIYAFSPSQFVKDYNYEIRNPGAEYFDIVGVDLYSQKGDNQAEIITKALEVVVDYAEAHNKVPAFTEFGYRGGIQNCDNPNWFTEKFLNPILANEKAKRITYALTWRNTPNSYWIPLKDNPLHSNFKEIYDSPYVLFLKDWNKTK
ncbi:MAG: glycosyl hydrolase [Rikenellaceae bacterium]